MSRKYLSTKDLAERYGINETTVWKWRKRGLLPEPLKFNRRFVRWAIEDIEAFEDDVKSRGQSAGEVA